jgi:hypothetical protein
MNVWRRLIAWVLSIAALLNFVPRATACGPSSIEPVFVFTESPDLPFEEFTRGKVGIVQSTFGRKTLFIAFRYLNGGAFTSEEQQALVEALRGKAPEDDGTAAVKAWLAERNRFGTTESKLPDVYTERQYGGYDFFPNCTKNAFEVATETLKDRVARFGSEDSNVRAWLATQDLVFQNCASGANIPAELGAESSTWIRKDREYQIGAALFYSLKFDEARARFEKIAQDNDSDWQQTADYLVARTLVRQASLTENETRKRELYDRAESHLQTLLIRGGQFRSASQKLLALVKYRIHPEARLRELAQILAQNGDDNLRQDLIDYVWLLDKFEAKILKEEAERKKVLKPAEPENPYAPFANKETKKRYEAVQNGELIEITFYPKKANGEADYSNSLSLYFRYDASEAEILGAFEQSRGIKLTLEETNEIKERREAALTSRKWLVSPNRKWDRQGRPEYEGCYYQCDDKLTLELVPGPLRADELTDWVFTFQSADPEAYTHALAKWRKTDSHAWLLAALAKAEKSSRSVEALMSQAERVQRDSPAFPTVAYHLVRLQMALGKKAEARKLLDEVLSSQSATLPISTQNQFLEQRMLLAETLNEFLKFAGRKPVAFYNEGTYARVRDLLKIAKGFWNAEDYKQTREEYEQVIEENYKDLLPWDDRFAFDEKTIDIFNWHFPLEVLADAAPNPSLPVYLQRPIVLAVWTRAILVKNETIAHKIAPEVIRVAPEMTSVFTAYLNARTARERDDAALYVFLKFPGLSPFLASGIPTFKSAEESDFYLESAWWCTPSDTDYDRSGNEVAKVVVQPAFVTGRWLAAARRERASLNAVGEAKSYLGKRAIEWAKRSPDDERVPEALYIAVRANQSYKYGCSGWDYDEQTKQQAETILRERYPRSPWTAKLDEDAQ